MSRPSPASGDGANEGIGLRLNPVLLLVFSVPSLQSPFSPVFDFKVCLAPLDIVNLAATLCNQVRDGVFCFLFIGLGLSTFFGVALSHLRLPTNGRRIVSIILVALSASASSSSCTGPSGVTVEGVAIVEYFYKRRQSDMVEVQATPRSCCAPIRRRRLMFHLHPPYTEGSLEIL